MASRSQGLWIGRTGMQATHGLMPRGLSLSCASIPGPASLFFSGLACASLSWLGASVINARATPERDVTLLCLGGDRHPARSGTPIPTPTTGTDSCAPLDQQMEGTSWM